MLAGVLQRLQDAGFRLLQSDAEVERASKQLLSRAHTLAAGAEDDPGARSGSGDSDRSGGDLRVDYARLVDVEADVLVPDNFPGVFIYRASSEVVAHKTHNEFDVVYVDGDHSFQGMQKDVGYWLHKLGGGGAGGAPPRS